AGTDGEPCRTPSLANVWVVGGHAESARERPFELGGVHDLGEPPLGLDLVLLARRRPGKIRRADEPRLALEEAECEDPPRRRRREEDRQRGAVHVAEQRCALGADGVQDRTYVVHTLLERGHTADAVGRAGAALVEAEDAHALRHLVEAGPD